ncbi:helix-turn-helix domain-containing protein [Inquilinus limosus]|uniref:helix-turn-helix domain-containing protein n=1 Tax=Inquilinus limosus TaxID=171674 RepID=UPI00126A3FD0
MFISTARAARHLDFDPSTLQAMARRGVVPGAKKFGRLWRFESELFFAWVKDDSDRQRGVKCQGSSNGKTVKASTSPIRKTESKYMSLLGLKTR